jgi:hypothetical protein
LSLTQTVSCIDSADRKCPKSRTHQPEKMRLTLVLALLLVSCLVFSPTFAKKAKKKVQATKKEEPVKKVVVKDELDMIADDIKDEDKGEVNIKDSEAPVEVLKKNPCSNFHCGAGKQCDLDEFSKPMCICVRECPPEADDRRKVCSNHNETWESDCELYRMRCFCEKDTEQCQKKKYKHAHVDYYGACRDIEPCTPEEMEDFPRRMRDWLFNVMKDLAHRNELEKEFIDLEKEAETSIQHKWVNAVIWKFCDLDSHPHDRSVSRHELFPIRAPLLAMEHCIAPFLDTCDVNDDHQITLTEWGTCLGLEEDEIKNKCPKSVE